MSNMRVSWRGSRAMLSCAAVIVLCLTMFSSYTFEPALLRQQAEARTLAQPMEFRPAIGLMPSVGPIGAGKCQFFAETRRTLCDAFLDYWQRYGGLSIFGFPLSWEIQEDGRTVQYFERAKLEYHPEAVGTDWAVMGELMGNAVTAERLHQPQFQRLPSVDVSGNCVGFEPTGHTLCGAFKDYWDSRGGLWMFGYPISEEFEEKNRDTGQTYIVQYFERARFEWHPENAGTEYEVLLGRLGYTMYNKRYDHKDQDLINVRDFGARGDGSTDDTAAFLAAFAAVDTALPKSTVVYVPNGTYMLRATPNVSNESLILRRNGVLVGESITGTTLKMIASSVGADWENIRFIRAMRRTRVTNLTFDGNREQFDRSVITMKAATLLYTREGDSEVVVEHIRARGAYGQRYGDNFKEGHGVLIQEGNSIVRNVEAYENDGSGVSVGGSLYFRRPENILIDSVYAHHNRSMGVSLFAANNVTVTQINAEFNRRGLNTEWSTNTTFRNSRTSSNDWYGISIVGGNDYLLFENIESVNNGLDASFGNASEIGIMAHTWWYQPDPLTGNYTFSIAQNLIFVGNSVIPSGNRPHVSILTSEEGRAVPPTQVGPKFTEQLLLQSPGASEWGFLVDGNRVNAQDLPGYVLATFGLAIRTQ